MSSILIIEDELALVLVLQELFESRGFLVLVATDGAQALEILDSQVTPDIVLTDLYLPKHTGSEIVAYIRRTSTLKHIPVVVVSGSWDLGTLPDYSYQAFIAKPFNLADVVETVNSLLCPSKQAHVS